MRTAILLVLATILAGCGSPDGGTTPTPPATKTVEAPWWEVGEYWQVDLTRGGRAETFRLVNFWNDSATSHFWLGVSDRQQALDMALHDDNPLLGRIHWNILTPHENGMHAQGLYNFPVEDGETFGGIAFGSEWSLTAKAGDKPGTMTFAGRSTDGETISYDYDPASKWFTSIEIQDDAGATTLRADVRDHGTGAKGTYWFNRGRDYHLSTDPAGTKEETFDVKDEGMAHKSLALEFKGTVNGLLRIDVLDPDGQSRHSETLTGGTIAKVVEIPSPKVGPWTIRYAGTGALRGTIEAVGILEYTRTL